MAKISISRHKDEDEERERGEEGQSVVWCLSAGQERACGRRFELQTRRCDHVANGVT